MVLLKPFAAGLLAATTLFAPAYASLEEDSSASPLNHAHRRHHHALAKAAQEEADVEKRASRGKAGLAWSNGDGPDMKQYMTTNKVSWYYTWSPWPACNGKKCPTWCPMLWSSKQIDAWKRNVVGKSFDCVLGFNEPDINGQSNMSVGEAISLWNKWVKPVKARHISPAVTMSPKGLKWLDEFIDRCKNCDIDAYALHYYGIDADDFIKRVKAFRKAHPNKPIWITEVACHNYGDQRRGQCNPAKIRAFMKKIQEWMDKTDYIQKYAWFAANKDMPKGVPFNGQNMIMNKQGKINDLGRQYIGA